MELLTKSDIIFINKKTIERHGGNFVPPENFLNEPPLDYLVDIIDGEIFGSPIYPTISNKAGVYLFNIISNHIFQDGNKRTGLESVLLFLRLNSYRLKKQLVCLNVEGTLIPSKSGSSNEILITFILEVASGKISLETCQSWLKENIVAT